MQGKGVVKFFAILLAIVCLYQLSFTWVAHKVKDDAKVYAKGDTTKEKAYLDSIATQPVYPILKHDYQYVSQRALALGLDLEGGMSVTMQISLDELVKKLSNDNTDVYFNQAIAQANKDIITSQTDYITLFVSDYEKINPQGKLATIFSTKDNQDRIKFNATNSEVETYLKDNAKSAVTQSFTILNTRIDQFGVANANIQQTSADRILIELPGVKEPERVRKLLSGTAKMEFYQTYDNSQVTPLLSNLNSIIAAENKASKKDTAKTAAAAKTDTTKKLASAKADTTKEKGALALLNKVQKSGAKDTSSLSSKTKGSDLYPLFDVLKPMMYQGQNGQTEIAPGPVVGRADVKDTAKVDKYLRSVAVKSAIPQSMKFLWGVKPMAKTKTFELYAVKLVGANNGPVLTGEVITDAFKDVDQKGSPEVRMIMNSDGAEKWSEITTEACKDPNNHQSIAIVLDDNVYSAPRVDNPIPGGVSSISGNFTTEEAGDLANVLKAGRLPAPAHIVAEAVVGPSLGKEAVNAGLLSNIVGLLVVMVFMIAYYNRAGTVAVVAVLINIFFLMGVLTSLGAVLTMPGVAGIVLTFGLSVDANVLIYERVREELALGKSLKIAVADGFKHALSSILDSNISTFLTGLILYVFGTGTIQGFAITLMIGIITSLFCSLLISRIILEYMIEKGWDVKFSNPWSSHTFKNANYAFVKNRFKYYIFSGSFILLGIGSMVTRGFNYGVDFVGGRTYVIRFDDKNVGVEQVRTIIDKNFGSGNEVKTFGSDISVTTKYDINDNAPDADAKVETAVIKALDSTPQTHITAANIRSQQKVAPTIANGLKKSATLTVLFAIIIISGYIFIRFRKWQFSLGAMIATAHDALMVLSFFSIFKDVLPFSLDIDQSFIAAILTVIGYSINDTVVVFDRIREFLNLHHAKTDDPKAVINDAINNTLSRTIITALTVLMILLVLFIFGGDVIRGFSFALLIGVCFGTYSSICVATPVIIDFGKKDLR
ncbi:protein translocase subunit SecDF [Mucilaginibacter gotjawali]|uniref:Multifunctional fusion protein n=2 Tax=Mucilaginibacter gotjawali TaxID=1550579 RepID=A0A120MZ78_9SPHI|nr:protein translocase subunit SecDF [Mucilaginibacter gotjawali]MBB3057609.1 SecD/SecF fusion protein [Mucilaginibacter gotjawali]BAU55271.1 bifunctional preprotein translocase subunit SecD/SecF [Mucilaginibacter gotjawali]